MQPLLPWNTPLLTDIKCLFRLKEEKNMVCVKLFSFVELKTVLPPKIGRRADPLLTCCDVKKKVQQSKIGVSRGTCLLPPNKSEKECCAQMGVPLLSEMKIQRELRRITFSVAKLNFKKIARSSRSCLLSCPGHKSKKTGKRWGKEKETVLIN